MAGWFAAWMVLMTSIEFVCPHCSGRFELENPPAGGHVACPLCGQTLAIPAELPPADEQTPSAASDANQSEFDFVGPGDAEAPPLAFDVGELAPLTSPSRRRRSKAREDKPVVERLSREEKERRRQVRSLVWMIGGAVLLVIAVAVLSRL